jgi:hypothetical protein
MNQKNFEYLTEQLKYHGFGQGLNEQLLVSMQKQLPQFSLQHRMRFGNDELTASLNFQRSARQDLYFFHSYLASLKNYDQPLRINQLFYMQGPGSITLKEAFNLLQGRAVEKQLVNRQGDPYQAWVQLDFKNTDQQGNFKIRQFHQNYGFDLPEVLSRLSLKELDHQQSKANLLASLRKGNRQQVTLIDQGVEHKFFIEASPQFKGIIAYDQNSVRRHIHALTGSQQLLSQKSPHQALQAGDTDRLIYQQHGLSAN